MRNTLSTPNLLAFPFRDEEIARIFSSAYLIEQMVNVELALAQVQAEHGLIPTEAGQAIAARASAAGVDEGRLLAGMERDGVPVRELVAQLREQVGEPHARFVHFGTTTQDILDSALVLQIRASLAILEPRMQTVIANLARLADRHRLTVMPARTHGQQAVPISFGLKVAGWLTPLLRHRQRIAEIKPRVLTVQLGGAAGSLAPLEQHGAQIGAALAAKLGLGAPLMPWHTQRDSLAELAAWLSLVSGSLAKMAQDVILLAQSEVAELHESADPDRGGSSTMPQKNNPVVSEQIVAAARANASLLSSMYHALIQEHERGTHGWQLEWLTLPPMIELTAATLQKAVVLSGHLRVDAARMQENVERSNGLIFAEAVSFALSESLGAAVAKAIVAEACQVVEAEGRHLFDVVREKTDADVAWERLRESSAYMGASQAFIDRVVEAAAG